MRSLSLTSLLLVCAGCTVRVPMPPALKVSVKAAVRAEVKAGAQVKVEAPPAPVPIQGAAVVEFFGIPLEGAQDIVFVLDRSGSMAGTVQGRIAQVTTAPDPAATAAADPAAPAAPDPAAPAPAAPAAPRKIDVARAELNDALRRLPAGTRLNVIFFEDGLLAYAPGLIPLEDTGRERLIAFVDGITATGMTALAPALRNAFLMNAQRVVLLSDGLGNVGGDSRAILRDAREAMLGGVRIDAIGIGGDQDDSLLRTLASESGGLYQAL